MRRIALVHRHVKTGLLKFFLDIDSSLGLEGQQVGAHPSNLRDREALFANIDGGSRKVGRSDVSFRRGRIAVDALQMALKATVRTAEFTWSDVPNARSARGKDR